ncbi:TorF family putative porin [Thalassotalea marina]|uniref:Porin n=1 Tax=Thalassotalea marina TaxID=1673741 RepID=A0A919BIZ7_9GAMM|nr:TorF family putative porin [Thalassotalea marina]GHF92344.1 hypothetical protein GCM10017161_20560 [Thalassotalea marina]
MKNPSLLRYTAVALCLTASSQAYADVSGTVTLVSDYLFNGVTQTDEKPALQGSLDWSNKYGVYAGVWGSNVDFNDGTDMEVDYYVGYAGNISSATWYDVGFVYYSYLGDDDSSDINYSEIYFQLGYQDTSVKVWYADDYAGTDAKHYVIALMHTLPIRDNLSIDFQIDRSKSLNDDKFTWEGNDDSYFHWKAIGQYSWNDVNFGLGVEGTDLDTYGETRVIATVSYTFNF